MSDTLEFVEWCYVVIIFSQILWISNFTAACKKTLLALSVNHKFDCKWFCQLYLLSSDTVSLIEFVRTAQHWVVTLITSRSGSLRLLTLRKGVCSDSFEKGTGLIWKCNHHVWIYLDFSHLKMFSQIVCVVLRMIWLWVSSVFSTVSQST